MFSGGRGFRFKSFHRFLHRSVDIFTVTVGKIPDGRLVLGSIRPEFCQNLRIDALKFIFGVSTVQILAVEKFLFRFFLSA